MRSWHVLFLLGASVGCSPEPRATVPDGFLEPCDMGDTGTQCAEPMECWQAVLYGNPSQPTCTFPCETSDDCPTGWEMLCNGYYYCQESGPEELPR